jgi:hypothetical protein
MVLSLGLALAAVGVVTGPAFLLVGGVVFAAGLIGWVGELLPGEGHIHERLVEPVLRPRPATGAAMTVEQLRAGAPGYRLRLPERVHPISAGVRGGIIGGLVMPAPALIWGLLSGHGIWYPVNLLAGMVLPGVGDMLTPELQQFSPALLVVGLIIHATMSVVLGLIYGVLLPTLPDLPKPFAWGGLLMPLLWTGVGYGLMGVVNPVLQQRVDWPWFVASQFVFGVTAAVVVVRSETVHIPPAGRGPDRVSDFVTGDGGRQS